MILMLFLLHQEDLIVNLFHAQHFFSIFAKNFMYTILLYNYPMPEQEEPREIWTKVSEDAKRLASAIAPAGDLSMSKDFLEQMVEGYPEDFNLDKNLNELTDLGIVQETNLIQEKRERLDKMKRPREMFFAEIEEVPHERRREFIEGPNEEELKYLRLLGEINDYETNHEQFPEQYQGWEKPRFKLRPEYHTMLSEQPDSIDPTSYIENTLRMLRKDK